MSKRGRPYKTAVLPDFAKVCAYCGIMFCVYPYANRHNRRKFCTDECTQAEKRKRKREQYKAQKEDIPIKIPEKYLRRFGEGKSTIDYRYRK